jgi:dipeptidyl aminopeptidase/acylaminoacyl peptidase
MRRLNFCATLLCGLALAAGASAVPAADSNTTDAAAAFGARADITSLRLSPDGASVVFITPIQGQGSVVYTTSLAPGAKPKVAFYADGKPFRVRSCSWVANDRLVCTVFALMKDQHNVAGLLPVTRLMAVNADGTKPQQLSTEITTYTKGQLQQDEAVIDWLPDQDGSVLMEQEYHPNTHEGSMIGSDLRGLGVDLIDTRTLAVKHIIKAREDAAAYISDGRGTVRIAEVVEPPKGVGYSTGIVNYLYRQQGSDEWQRLSTYNQADSTGFRPIAVDHDLNVAYGWKKLDGRWALYSMTLDGSPHEQLVYSRPDVDLSSLLRIGRRNRVVGAGYSTELPHSEVFSADIKELMSGLHQALPQKPLQALVDSSVDENKLLVFAGSDNDPGAYYILDRQAHSLHAFLPTRAKLQGVTLAHVKPITYSAGDGQKIPGYLTLPPGVDNPHGLPAIVMPHGGPDARDHWGFDWLAQFYAARGYVVLQPNFRGSSGYGDAWFKSNGFKSWDVAVGDVVAAGRWLVSEGIADPAKLGVVGWSYGGYAALQSVDIDPNLFKAIIAIAPVTDLAALKQESLWFSNHELQSDYIGDGPHMVEGSPIKHADKFKQPVLLFHGTIDRTVSVEESKRMAEALKAAGAQCQLVTFEGDDHDLDDSAVRADMLRQSDAFLRHAFGMSP